MGKPRKISRAQLASRCAGLLVLAIAPGLVFAATASAAYFASGSFTVKGALRGTLTLRGPDCATSANGVEITFNASLSGAKYKSWTVSALVAKPGTYTTFKPGDGTTFSLASGLNVWVSTSGKLVVKATSGTVNAVLGDHEGAARGTVTITGSWSCPPGS